jgi:hypothetical protein
MPVPGGTRWKSAVEAKVGRTPQAPAQSTGVAVATLTATRDPGGRAAHMRALPLRFASHCGWACIGAVSVAPSPPIGTGWARIAACDPPPALDPRARERGRHAPARGEADDSAASGPSRSRPSRARRQPRLPRGGEVERMIRAGSPRPPALSRQTTIIAACLPERCGTPAPVEARPGARGVEARLRPPVADGSGDLDVLGVPKWTPPQSRARPRPGPRGHGQAAAPAAAWRKSAAMRAGTGLRPRPRPSRRARRPRAPRGRTRGSSPVARLP